jgi:hypothetical protein
VQVQLVEIRDAEAAEMQSRRRTRRSLIIIDNRPKRQCRSWPRTVVLKAFSLMKTEQSLSKMKEEIAVDKDLFSDSTV